MSSQRKNKWIEQLNRTKGRLWLLTRWVFFRSTQLPPPRSLFFLYPMLHNGSFLPFSPWFTNWEACLFFPNKLAFIESPKPRLLSKPYLRHNATNIPLAHFNRMHGEHRFYNIFYRKKNRTFGSELATGSIFLEFHRIKIRHGLWHTIHSSITHIGPSFLISFCDFL